MMGEEVLWDDFGRVCNSCSRRLKWISFAINSKGVNGRKSICRDCSRASQKELYKKRKQADPKAFNETLRYRELWKKYRITQEDFEWRERAQGYKCACCGKTKRKGVNLFVDHCHKTGAIRGLLCNNCNSGIGKLGDTKEGVFKALRYLEKFERNPW